MAKQETGGPAFPRPGYYPDDPNERMEIGERRDLRTDPQDGMTLRDYFAAQVAGGYVGVDSIPNPNDVANYAYEVADAMLKARIK